MKNFLIHVFPLNRIFNFRHIAVNNIRCQKKPFSVFLGFGGKTIDYFPPYKFFKKFTINQKDARQDFATWMRETLYIKNAWKVCQTEGGWAYGSLIQQIRQLHLKNGIDFSAFYNADPSLVNIAIEQKVNHYFDLFCSLRDKGFKKHIRPFIHYQLDSQGLCVLQNGHHRVSALKVLGYSTVYARRVRG